MKFYALVLAVSMLLAVGCNSKDPNKNTTEPAPAEQNDKDQAVSNGASENAAQANDLDSPEATDAIPDGPSGTDEDPLTPDEVYGSKGVGINQDLNPDNLNMAFDVAEEKSHIQYVPLLSDEEKDAYFVQILVSAYKLPKAHFERSFKDSQRIYVAHVGDNYKYALAKLDSKAEAESKLKELQQAYGLKKAKVARFSN